MRARTAHSEQLALVLFAAFVLTACGSAEPAEIAVTTQPPDPSRAPAELRWENYQGVQLPIGGKDGPTKLASVPIGYTHTPQGAALAAINHSARLSLAPDSVWPALAANVLQPGPGKDAWVLARVQLSITAATDPAVAPHFTAYKITTYDPARTTLTVYATYSDASITATDTTVTWSAEDWRLLLPDPAAKTVTVHSVKSVPADAVALAAAK
ncbi:hypothetical protein [Nocardia inohanensis]|uniref:hypothetical protein n=1 Tax=Nocardia inohanensis TaxID=209246 RepID=UPI000833C62D|nr:hypothetical protein [Nocardia inohanensis]